MASRKDRQLTLLQHLEELRRRLFRAALAIVATTALAFIFTDRIFRFLLQPMGGVKPIFIDVTEMLSTYFKVAIMTGIALGLPVIIYELAMFIAPALTPKEKRYLFWLLPSAMLLFVAGVAFSYFIFLPSALHFLLQFGSDIAEPQIRIGNYISVVTQLLFWSGLTFETPLVMLFLSRIGLVSYKTFARWRRWAVVLAFVLGAFITPTFDPVNQTLIAVPVIFLYEIGIWLSRWFTPRRAAMPTAEAEEG